MRNQGALISNVQGGSGCWLFLILKGAQNTECPRSVQPSEGEHKREDAAYDGVARKGSRGTV